MRYPPCVRGGRMTRSVAAYKVGGDIGKERVVLFDGGDLGLFACSTDKEERARGGVPCRMNGAQLRAYQYAQSQTDIFQSGSVPRQR